MDLIDAIDNSPDESLRKEFHKSVDICLRTIALFSLDGIAFSFNGGKDSTVLLHVIRAAIAKYCSLKNGRRMSDAELSIELRQMRTIYFNSANMFQEIKEFLTDTAERYGFLIHYLDGNFKNGLVQLVEQHRIKAVFMGQRLSDPGAVHLEHFSPTDPGWPPIMRVNPILMWSYTHVWRFLRDFEISYCRLYDQGYTSIGSLLDTLPNPSLQRADGTFLPACELLDSSKERDGRISNRSSSSNNNSSSPLPSQPQPQPQPPSPQPSLSPLPRTSSLEGRTAAVVVVGSDILAGKVQDSVSFLICQEVRRLGIDVRLISVISDDVHTISRSISSLANNYDFVFIAGGLGAAYEDRTVEGVAGAFQAGVTQDPAYSQTIRNNYGSLCTSHHLRMADIPSGALLLFTDKQTDISPVILFRNCFLFPGLSSHIPESFRHIAERLKAAPIYLVEVS
mmetsp:Transcript_38692/g.64296  ORF Transcript_38692/g.64296 Transcript_38692/m.64296 type:complete len:451 (-) Transcript_38692:512-1864(-)|eukprot:CAMPEP_0184340354 /NCGR_PEP_ID=MMETSP1089-20130417/9037_1 /TAXON_ID=38269 ORGANISM="Gloeochaete wittrockiana, Strain SAG46.84" /NCGR_SAMPLE_ID=MMETSP1089 /ASSEMBLY_ACC=CAM_ASM_000445 /LENGTH=450 /DNA_ID=CAMNT_0026668131 /DNA_START=98 /DNA_END=1450 /DNA_ORIENTATION=+